MGLLGKTFKFANKFKDQLSQGLLKAKDFVYNNRKQIGGALKAASPYIGAINPTLGTIASKSGSFLSNLKPGPVKDKLSKLAHESYDDSPPKRITVDSGAQQLVELKRRALRQPKNTTERKRKTKKRK